MTKGEFYDKLSAAGFKTFSDFAKTFGLHYASISRWLATDNFPIWVSYVLDVGAKARKYDKIVEKELVSADVLKTL